MRRLFDIPLILSAALLWGCASTLRPFQTERVTPGLQSKVHDSLQKLPSPQEKVVAAVYRFRDQTGQYKPSEQVASWSTAVTQGATSILIKAMENSGWFMPIEREGLSNLLNERKIIQATRQAHGDNQQLRPLLFAGVILEGGIIGYDTNIITGGAGLRYLGTGVSGQFRKDQVTIYLRAVSTTTGRILKTVHTTKSIISEKLDSGAFRFVDTNRLLEAEAGYSFNEPPVLAVTEAIDEAVRELVIDGVKDNLWSPADTSSFDQYVQDYQYQKQKEAVLEKNYFGLAEQPKLRSGLNLSANFIYGSHIGSYANANQNPGVALDGEYFLNNGLALNLNLQRSSIGSQNVFSRPFSSGDLMLNAYLTPEYKLSPYIGVGGGVLAYDTKPDFADSRFFPAAAGEAGLDYRFNNWLGFKIGVNYRYVIRDGIDGISQGTIHEQQWNIVTGVTIKPKIF